MDNIKELLEKRKQMKRKRPSFFRKDRYKKSRIGNSWRKPRGLDNKQRLGKKGPAIKISNGYRAPKAVRGLHKSGLLPVVVFNVAQLSSLNKEQGVVVSANAGNRKRLEIITEAEKKGLVILNLDAGETLTRIQSNLKERKEMKAKQLAEQKEVKKGIDEKIKKAEQKKESQPEEQKKGEAELSEEEKTASEKLADSENERFLKKKQEKEEKDKLLTKRE